MSADGIQASAGTITVPVSGGGGGIPESDLDIAIAFRSKGESSTATVSAVVDPSFSFSVANRATACNGESGFVGSAGAPTAIALGHLGVSAIASGGQAVTVSSNAGHGFTVYLRGTQASQNLRSAGHNWTDGGGTYATPAGLGANERFAYTYKDSTTSSSVTNPGNNLFVALDSTNRAFMGSSTSQAGSACLSFAAQTDGATPAGSYSATIIYTAVPSF